MEGDDDEGGEKRMKGDGIGMSIESCFLIVFWKKYENEKYFCVMEFWKIEIYLEKCFPHDGNFLLRFLSSLSAFPTDFDYS